MQAVPIATATPNKHPTEPTTTPGAIPGQISLEDALKGGDTAKIDAISMGRIGDAATAGNQVSLGSLVEAKLCLEIIDALIPSALVLIFHAAKVQLNKSVFQFTAKEKDVLAPIVQKCLESVNLNFDSPWLALGITAGAFYLAKASEHGGKAKIDKANEVKKNENAVNMQNELDVQANAKAAKERSKKSLSVVPDENVLRAWDEDDIKKVIKKRRKGREDAIAWLNNNWNGKGGVI